MPAAVVAKLNTELNNVLKSQEFSQRMEADGSAIVGGAPEVLTQTLRADIDRWKALVKTAGIRIE